MCAVHSFSTAMGGLLCHLQKKLRHPSILYTQSRLKLLAATLKRGLDEGRGKQTDPEDYYKKEKDSCRLQPGPKK